MSFVSYVSSFLTGAGASLVGGGVESTSASAQRLGSGIWPLSPLMREEMKKGIRYNMKVILRGPRATGKTTLLARLSGHSFSSSYYPSTEIGATTLRLLGESCAPQHGTKVDIWDVVDEGRHRSGPPPRITPGHQTAQSSFLSAHMHPQQVQDMVRTAADARSIDVYQGCQLVMFLIDPRRRETFDYAIQHAQQVPFTTCVLFLLNFSDVADSQRVVEEAAVQRWCSLGRRTTTAMVHHLLEGREAPLNFSVPPMWASISARTGAGMQRVYEALQVINTLLCISSEEQRLEAMFGQLRRQVGIACSVAAAPPTALMPSPAPPAQNRRNNTVAEPVSRRTSPAPVVHLTAEEAALNTFLGSAATSPSSSSHDSDYSSPLSTAAVDTVEKNRVTITTSTTSVSANFSISTAKKEGDFTLARPWVDDSSMEAMAAAAAREMVQDTAAPADEFFTDVADGKSASAASEAAHEMSGGAQPDEVARTRDGYAALATHRCLRPLKTHRMPSALQAEEAASTSGSTLRIDVAAMVADMTEALALRGPEEESVLAKLGREEGREQRKDKSQRRRSKHRSVEESKSSLHEKQRHKKGDHHSRRSREGGSDGMQ